MNDTERKETVQLLVTARGAVNDAIRNINSSTEISSTEFWKLREFTQEDWMAYAGCECDSPYICDVSIDGYEGQMIVEPDYVGIYIIEDTQLQAMQHPTTLIYERDFGKQRSDRFLANLELGMQFAKWLIEAIKYDWGLDDLVDIAGMVKH